MNPQEILPEPEIESRPEVQHTPETADENAATIKTEQKNGPSSGFGAVNAVALDDAQSQVQGVVQADLGATSTAAMTQLDVPAVADDLDLIEKEWVRKAKEIVMATQGDPYNQNKQMNEMKVDYIKKRYNKDIKIRKE